VLPCPDHDEIGRHPNSAGLAVAGAWDRHETIVKTAAMRMARTLFVDIETIWFIGVQ
jgi:hypothetical protein